MGNGPARQPEHRPEGSYALRYMFQSKQRWESVGQDADAALSALKERAWQINNQDTLTSIHDALAAQSGRAVNREPEPEAKGKYPLDKAIQVYLRDVAATASKRTVAGYAYTLAEFRKVCKKAYIEDVVKSDLTAFVAAMKAEQITRMVKGVEEKIPRYTDRTIANRVDEVVGLLRDKRESRGAGKGILNVKLPIKYAKKKVVSYKPEQLKRLFEAADQEQRERFLFFLDSGFRDQECQQARWEAVDFEKRSIVLRETDDFTTKDREERHIPLSREVVDMLKARRERYPAAVLIFPAKDGGKPEGHFLRSLKRLALKAGLNCGNCINKLGESCADAPVCRHWILHRFRKTMATARARAGMPLFDLSRHLGHSDIKTTKDSYLQELELEDPRVREYADKAIAAYL